MPREARTLRAIGGDAFIWSVEAYLLAALVDLGAGGNWQRGGGQGTRPKPIVRPGQDGTEREGRRLGKGVPVEELRTILDNW